MMTFRILVGLAFPLLVAAPAAAQQTQITSGQHDFIDKNDDGAISRQEYNQYISAAFKHLDANGNGSLDRKEVGTLLTDSQFAQADQNKDGRITEAELLKQADLDFAAADKDKSGSLK